MEKGPAVFLRCLYLMMIGNMAAGMIAIRHDCRGSAIFAVT